MGNSNQIAAPRTESQRQLWANPKMVGVKVLCQEGPFVAPVTGDLLPTWT